MHNTDYGFSLIELLLAMAIAGILAAISYPCYSAYQATVARHQAEVQLLCAASALTQQYDDVSSYADINFNKISCIEPKKHAYRFVLGRVKGDHFLLKAVPSSLQVARDIDCGILTLTDTNLRENSGAKTVDDCWS